MPFDIRVLLLVFLIFMPGAAAWPAIVSVTTVGEDGQLTGLHVRFEQVVDASGADVSDLHMRGCACIDPRLGHNTNATRDLFVAFAPEGNGANRPWLEYRPIAGARITAEGLPLNDTQARARDGVPPVPVEAVTEDQDDDGRADSLRVRFSEPLDSGSFDAAYWRSGDVAVRSASIVAPDTLRIWLPGPVPGDATPELTTLAAGGLRDRAGNPMPRLEPQALSEQDRVAPRIVSATLASPNATELIVRFSEPVRWAGDLTSPLVDGDLRHQQHGGATWNASVRHEAGTPVARVMLEAPMHLDGEGRRMAVAAGAVSDMDGNIASVHSVPVRVDAEPPARIRDLRADARGTAVVLSWVAPSDADLASYEIRYAEHRAAIDDGALATAPAPRPGERQEARIDDLTPGRHYVFRIRSLDHAGNIAEPSPFAGATPMVDARPPDRVEDLRAEEDGATVVLSWTAPRDHGSGVHAYEIRVVENASDADGFLAGRQIPSMPPPAEPGTLQSVRVEGLGPGPRYSFFLRSVDAAGNVAETSNAATWSPAPPGPGPTPAAPTVHIVPFEAVRKEGGNRITWQEFPEEGRAMGLQVWVMDGTPVLLQDLPSTSPSFVDRSYLHESVPEQHRYLLTAYFAATPEAGYLEEAPDQGRFQSVSLPEDHGLPITWIAAPLGLAVLAGVGGVVVVRRRPGRKPALAKVDPVDEPAGPGEADAPAAWADAARAPPEDEHAHEVECPSCLAVFEAHGLLPLDVACPECGSAGRLE